MSRLFAIKVNIAGTNLMPAGFLIVASMVYSFNTEIQILLKFIAEAVLTDERGWASLLSATVGLGERIIHQC